MYSFPEKPAVNCFNSDQLTRERCCKNSGGRHNIFQRTRNARMSEPGICVRIREADAHHRSFHLAAASLNDTMNPSVLRGPSRPWLTSARLCVGWGWWMGSVFSDQQRLETVTVCVGDLMLSNIIQFVNQSLL